MSRFLLIILGFNWLLAFCILSVFVHLLAWLLYLLLTTLFAFKMMTYSLRTNTHIIRISWIRSTSPNISISLLAIYFIIILSLFLLSHFVLLSIPTILPNYNR